MNGATQQRVVDGVAEQWQFEGRDDLVGWSDEAHAHLLWQRYLDRFDADTTMQKTLLIYSDGSYKDNGPASKASYGWVIWGFEGEEWCGAEEGESFMQMEEVHWSRGIEGGGIVHGDPSRLDSTRAEHHGSLAVLIAARLLGWMGKVAVRLDNMGVTHRMDKYSEKGNSGVGRRLRRSRFSG